MEKINLSADNGKAKKTWLYIFLAIIVILVGFLIFTQIQEQEQAAIRMQYIEEKNALRDDLDDLIDEHDGLLEEYGDLNNQLQDKDSIIQHQISEIRSLIRTSDLNKRDLDEARQKIAVLQEIVKRYLSNIDSLLVINKNLTSEKDSVIKENKNINWKNYKLSKQNEVLAAKVSRGTVLEISNVDIECLRYRSTGKEVSTGKAKKLQKLRVCFTIRANQISEAEEKMIFMQLINPEGKLVKGKEDIQVSVADSILYFTTSSSFDYQNIEMNSCFEWERLKQLTSGNYLVNLILEGRVSAQAQFKLK
ncbi:MAG: hypothetical protein VX689_00550 [Bacteroidota bacterium]|nr:hypothetical protein [Bacteroidota bacterium]